jgi:alpha-ketoglutarate-dependent 2,4-dichlorophenoxyacetate dioxygenase
MKTTALHPHFGLKIEDIDLNEITAHSGYPEIRCVFEQSSLLYFPNQKLDDKTHLRVGALFGPREDRSLNAEQPLPKVSLVSNLKSEQELYQPGEKRLLDLQANMLWHTDSTFLPVPALANILIGQVIPPSGTATEFTSTRAAWDEMPDSLKNQARGVFLTHEYSYSRKKIDPELAQEEKFTHWPAQTWKSIWTNPVSGREALYIASHANGVVGMKQHEAIELIEALINWCTQGRYVYRHRWNKGDVLIWDERATMHRGVPWNYDEPRVLSSICVSATAKDGLDDVRLSQQT